MRSLHAIATLFLFLALCTAGCKKDIPAPDPVPADEADMTNTGDTIQMGVEANMFVQDLNYTFNVPLNGHVTKGLDVDSDGTVDIELHDYITVSMGAGFREYSWLQSLRPEVRIASLIVTDTSFWRVDTVGINIYTIYSCSRMHADDSIWSITPGRVKIRVFQEGELLTSDATYSPDSINLRRPTYTTSPFPTPQGGYQVSWQSHGDCYLFPEDVIRYTGIAITRPDGTLRLGWIKMKFSGAYVLFNIAIQQ